MAEVIGQLTRGVGCPPYYIILYYSVLNDKILQKIITANFLKQVLP
jgi:hypothetical protein